jgi:AhpD family alkylhydroperoxidase
MKLDNRTLRLIAVGASITANCQPCLRINVAKALESGADEPEIAAAIQVGKMVRQGAASKMDDFTSDLNPATLLVASPATEECGCSA